MAKLRQEYEALGLIIPDHHILTDEDDFFSYECYRNGEFWGISGIERCQFTWWRNTPTYTDSEESSLDAR